MSEQPPPSDLLRSFSLEEDSTSRARVLWFEDERAPLERALDSLRKLLKSHRPAAELSDPAVLLPLLDAVDTLTAALRLQLQAQATPAAPDPVP